jgi:Kef-type K+ transport system membrane component KefB
MLLIGLQDLSLPLKNPVLIFSILLFIILFAPILLNKFKIPHLIGLIIAGAFIGPNGFNLMLRDSSIILFGTVGLLYIMFLAGLEIDLAEFKKNSKKSLIFGLYTFTIPMLLGTTVAYYYLEFPLTSSVLLASMFASHTLIAYPIISKLGITKNRAVTISVGGTMITDTLALLVLAAIAGMSAGKVDGYFWLRLGTSVIIFGTIVMVLFPIIGRWFFKRFDDNISQYIFVLGMVFMGAFLAEAAGIEAIIGAFLAGLALNRLIPHTSPLMNRLEFVGNALFIPFFLIGVGMLIDFRVFYSDLETIKVAIVMVLIAISAKFLAAWAAQKTFGFSRSERQIIFGLSNAQAAATLAAVLVGYNIILNKAEIDQGILDGLVIEPQRLLNESVLNGTILMILVTCTIASIAALRGGTKIALEESSLNEDEKEDEDKISERILIPVNNEATARDLIDLSITIKSKNNRSGIYALNIIDEDSNINQEKRAKKILNSINTIAASTDNHITELIRYDLNIINGISGVVREHKITDVILGLHSHKDLTPGFLGDLTEGILTKCNTTTLIYKAVQPLSTIKRHIVIIPERAEKEIGFPFWLIKLWNIARNTGGKLDFYAPKSTLNFIKEIQTSHPVESDFTIFEDWDDFLILSREVNNDDNIVVVFSRKEYASYQPIMTKVPDYLNKYFKKNNFILIYPIQTGMTDDQPNLLRNPAVSEPLEKLDEIGKTIGRLFKRK